MGFKFKLRDLLVLTLLVALVMPLLIRAIIRARERSRVVACANNLKSVGIGMMNFSMADPASRYCSGATDFRRDGCIDTYGWVADAINMGTVAPNELLDASNPLRGTEAIQDMLVLDPSQADHNAIQGRSSHGMCGQILWKDISANATTFFAGTAAGSKERAEFLSRAFVGRGYNTNYAASWTMTRGSVKTTVIRNRLYTDPLFDRFLSVGSTTGPLTANVMDRSRVSSTNVAMLGCANSSGQVTTLAIAHDPMGVWGLKSKDKTTALKVGEPLAVAFTTGPSFWNLESNEIEKIYGGVPLMFQLECERGEPTTSACPPPTGTSLNGSNTYLQDTRAWRAVHSGKVNMLMSDASIQEFVDLNGDGILNPGFPVSKQEPVSQDSFVDDRQELANEQFFGGIFIKDLYGLGIFE